MDIHQAMLERHSVRRYLDKPIEGNIKSELMAAIDSINQESGLSIQLITDDPSAFNSVLATYGLLRNVRNCVAIVGKDTENLYETAGYYGEKLVLAAQQMGLNTCWVAGTYKKSAIACTIVEGERLVCVIAIGYGAVHGKPHRSKPVKSVFANNTSRDVPEWFMCGLRAALLAPTAVNQQKFRFTLLEDSTVLASATGGVYSEIDLGIVKYHFEIGAGKDNFKWK